ncbi:MAG TPA: hypothetical protein VFE23_06630 [Usitatibacter sp.]|jgi:hypothetical protein|nr:hypothetical protein [Usitatibacter sp.]
MRRLSIALLVVLGWLVVALALDRLVLAEQCPACVDVAALQLKLRTPAAEITYPAVSLVVLLGLPVLIFAIAMVPWRDLRSRQAWSHAVESWWEPTFWLLVALVLGIVLESIFMLTTQYLPTTVSAVMQRFTLTGAVSVHVQGHESATPLALTASLAGLVGLGVGGYLFLQNGMNGVMRWFKA